MRHVLPWVTILVIALLCAPPALAADDITDDDVQRAIDAGVAALFAQQRPSGLFSDDGTGRVGGNTPWPGAIESMAMLGLTFAPVSIKDERMLKGFDALLKLELQHVYTVSPRIMVISRLLRQLDRERREVAAAVLLKDVKWLQEAQNGIGAWGYDYESRLHDDYGWDFSNTQMAVLALSEAEMAGVEIDEKVMLKVQKLYLEKQNADGGWHYGMRGGFQATDHPDRTFGSYGSMTAAAVATLFITRDFLYRGVGCPCKNERSGPRPVKLDEAIDRGLDWLGERFTVERNPMGAIHNWKYYWLYSCERVGLAAGLKYLGTHDWYREGAKEIISEQGRWVRYVPDCAYCICFLAKGRAPILFNKLKFKGQWNNHPRDMRNLAEYVGHEKEQPINWQVITLEPPVSEWHDAPILYISAETALELSDDEKKKLREFTDTGGTVFFEASCGNRTIAAWFRKLAKELWPEWELAKLDREHAVYSADHKMTRIPVLYGLTDGVRTPVFFSSADLSCPWNTMAVAARKEAFDLGPNLYMYATDRRALRARLAGHTRKANPTYAEARIAAGPRRELTMARLSHGGDWYVGKNYRTADMLAATLAEKQGVATEVAALRREAELPTPTAKDLGALALKIAAEVDGKDLAADKVQVAWLTGRQGVSMGPEATEGMKKYLASGGFLLAEAAMGDERFDADFRKLAGALGLELKVFDTNSAVVTGQMDGATGYPLTSVKFRYALRLTRGQPFPLLYGLYTGDKLVGVYSPYDVSYCAAGYDAWDCRGYEPEDAQAVLVNVLLLVSGRK